METYQKHRLLRVGGRGVGSWGSVSPSFCEMGSFLKVNYTKGSKLAQSNNGLSDSWFNITLK